MKTAALLKEADDKFEEFQKQVRKEVEEKGYYEVGMDFFVQRAASRALFDEQWAKIDFTGIDVEEDDDDETRPLFLVRQKTVSWGNWTVPCEIH
uniref:Uncharacterized protein n=1 Tax=Oryza glumipatula TaxID=40148 RepID=A0A0D9ZVN9_9ORYZ